MSFVQTDKPGFVKDLASGGILSTDNNGLMNYKKLKAKDKQINTLQEKITQIETVLEKILRNLEIK